MTTIVINGAKANSRRIDGSRDCLHRGSVHQDVETARTFTLLVEFVSAT